MEVKEVIDPDFEQKSVILIEGKSKLEIITSPIYLPILESLREGYKTVKEIEKDYAKFVETEIRKHIKKDEKKIQELVEKRKRSDKSLYRYIQDLVKAGFVTVVGKRIDKPMIEKLFARTAKLFLNDKYYEKLICTSEEGIESISRLIELVYVIQKPEYNSVKNFISQMEVSFMNITNKLFQEYPEEYVKIVEKLSLQDVNAVLQTICIVDLITKQDNYKKLLSSINQ